MSFGELGKPFSDGKAYFREKGKVNKKVWYGLLGVVIALPILLIAAGLLSSADAVFRKMTTDFMNWIRPGQYIQRSHPGNVSVLYFLCTDFLPV